MRSNILHCSDKTVDLSSPGVMGILNITPDSFSDGGRFFDPGLALEHAWRLVEEGAGILDLGGESTRPGAEPVAEAEELRRVIPVIEALAPRLPVPISVDTSKPAVMRAAIEAGAGMINDVCALREPGALESVADADVVVCLMHMQGEPRSMQVAPEYGNVVEEVRSFLQQRVQACEEAGIARQRIVLDPGFGFGKALQHNIDLMRNLSALAAIDLPLLVGVSRKRMIGDLSGRSKPAERVSGSVAAALFAASRGASILRVHDVAETVDALKVYRALEGK